MTDPVIVNDLAQPKSLGQKISAESLPVVLPSDYAIPVDTTGLATESKQDAEIVLLTAIDGHVDDIETLITDSNTKLDSIVEKTAQAGFFTKAYDQVVPTSDATHDYYTSKLATVTQQTLTITYADATKAVATDYKVV